jgi:hypothetical protein
LATLPLPTSPLPTVTLLPTISPTDALPGDTCASAYKSDGFILASVEYGHERWCDFGINNGQTQTASTDCSQPCDENSSKYCGDADRAPVHQLGIVAKGRQARLIAVGAALLALRFIANADNLPINQIE